MRFLRMLTMEVADHAPPGAIQGLRSVPLQAGEVWLQDTEVVYLSGRIGLGRGWDVAVAVEAGASWGSRERHLAAGLDLALGPEDPASAFLPDVDGVCTLARHVAPLAGLGSVLAPSDAGHLYSVFLAGPTARPRLVSSA